jgi:lipoprotein-anchoring transpeptidase ErfK/SrfK
MMAARPGFFRRGGLLAWTLVSAVALLLGASTVLLASTADVRYQRDVMRMAFNDNLEVLEDVRRQAGLTKDTLAQLLTTSSAAPAATPPSIVVSIADHLLWYKQGDRILFQAPVATGSGKVLDKEGSTWKFETPRGRLVVQSKDSAPAWVPPDWHFVEQASKRGLGLVRLARGQSVKLGDGSEIAVAGSEVVRRSPDGRETPLEAADGREIVANGNLIVPPFGTNQRRYKDVLGVARLNLGDGYALHGTNNPASIGQSVSHGCVRLRNEDIQQLYMMVPVGTPVYIY